MAACSRSLMCHEPGEDGGISLSATGLATIMVPAMGAAGLNTELHGAGFVALSVKAI
jgi:hypothetical protein